MIFLSDFYKKNKNRKTKNGFTDEKLNKKNKKSESIFKISFVIVLLAVLFFGGKALIAYSKHEIRKSEEVESTKVVVPDIIGLDVDNAKEILNTLDINTQEQYSDNDFFDIDAVIKMSIDPGTTLEKGSTIMLYVCQKPHMEKASVSDTSGINIEGLPIRKNEVIVKNGSIDGTDLVLTLNNDSDQIIDSMKFTSGYVDGTGDKFLNKSSLHLNLNIEPFKDFKIRQKIKNPNISSITVEKIDLIKKDQGNEEGE